jgi:hypothetical protein
MQPIPLQPGQAAQPVPMNAAPIPIQKPAATPAVVRTNESVTARARGEKNTTGDEEEEEEGLAEHPFQDWCKEHADVLTSTCVHALILIILSLWMLAGVSDPKVTILSNPLEDLVEEDDLLDQGAEIDISDFDEAHPQEVLDLPPEAPDSEQLLVDHVEEGAESLTMVEPDFTSDVGPLLSDREAMGSGKGAIGSGQGLGGRGDRRSGAGGRGASKASENAVELALKWISEHQMEDGSWNFNHTTAKLCNGKCPDKGDAAIAKYGATGLAVLPFLGAGYTHESGKYKETVRKGLAYLVQNRKGGSYHEPEGTMYSHGLASLALCEAYGMSNSKNGIPGLGEAAQSSLKFIEFAQHSGGGWRYEPKEQGDTSVVGWQVMALKSGQMAGLKVNPATLTKVETFLKSVQSFEGNAMTYGYRFPGGGGATTAIGNLCRMYLGVERADPTLTGAVEWLAARGPSDDDMYYNYYATQVVFHHTNYKGALWEKWNTRMRDYLVEMQEQGEHIRGSWHFTVGHSSVAGGRLYSTCMGAMILEVYYRHMPIYSGKSLDEALNAADNFEVE